MTYYIFIENGKINGAGTARCLNEDILNLEVSAEVYQNYIKDEDKYIYKDGIIKENPNYEIITAGKQRQQSREEIIIKLNELDAKRIRAVCENEIKDPQTGETWIDYYNNEISKLRLQLNGL